MTGVRPPTTVKVGPLVYDVKFNSDYVRKLGINGANGESDLENLVITIGEHLNPQVQKQIMVHEILHCCFQAANTSFQVTKHSSEETIVSCLESPLLEVLKDNPQLLKWVTS